MILIKCQEYNYYRDKQDQIYIIYLSTKTKHTQQEDLKEQPNDPNPTPR